MALSSSCPHPASLSSAGPSSGNGPSSGSSGNSNKIAQWRAIYGTAGSSPYRQPSASPSRPLGAPPGAGRSLSASRQQPGVSPYKLADRPFSAFGSSYTGKPSGRPAHRLHA